MPLIGLLGGVVLPLHIFDILFDDLNEIAQGRPTRRRREGGSMTLPSRLDRILYDIPPGELLARNARAATLGKLTSQREISDHVPVVARLCGRAAVPGFRPFVPDWVLGLFCFPDLVRDLSMAEGLVGPGSNNLAPFDRLKDLMRVIAKAARRVAEEAQVGECDSPSACLHWISRARSAVRARDLDRLRDIVGRAPGLSDLFNCDGCTVVDSPALQQFCHLCVRDEINEQINDVKKSDLPVDEGSAKRNKLHARLSSWSPKGRRVSGIAVLGQGGGVSDDPFGDIRGHWEKVFNHGGGSNAAAESLGRFVQKCPDDLGLFFRDGFYLICDVNRICSWP